MYKYCTKKMVDKAVRQGREAVIKCASDKWWFFGTCTKEQLKWYYSHGNLSDNCALCEKFESCTNGCPLYDYWGYACHMKSDSLYCYACVLLIDWVNYPTATNFKKFQAKSRKLARVIGRLK